MRAYKNIKFEEFPDVADIKHQGRKSSVGKLHRGRGYCSSKNKRASRRYLKHVDRAADAKFERNSE